MQILENAPQGSPAWLTARATRFCASEAAAALGVSKYATRNDLLKQKATGIAEDVTPTKQALFDAGHASEAATGPIAEDIAGVEFYPAVGVADIDGLPLLASFDGIDMLEEVIWENKLKNAALMAQVADNNLEPHYWAQLEHQLLVSGAQRALFTCSDGTVEGTSRLWYESVPERRAQLIAAWKQFAIDLAAYQPAPVEVVAVGRAPETLPALHIEVTGMVTASNLDAFKSHALAVFGGINRELKTDADFANAEQTVKWCGDVESRLAAAKQHALSQTASIDTLFTAIDAISAEARAVRLELDKLVKARKEAIRGELVAAGVKALADHVAALNARLGKPYMPIIPADFGGAIKGKRTVDSLRDAVDTTLANAKIAASATADRIQANLTVLRELGANFKFLFADAAQIVLKQTDDLTALVKSRIADHQAAEAAKEAATRERIRAEEAAKLAREAEEKAAAERREQARLAEVAKAVEVLAPQPVAAPAPNVVPMVRTAPVAQRAPATPPTLKLGQIAERLGFALTGDFLKSIGFEPAARDKSALLFHEAQFGDICAALVAHIEAVQSKQAA